MALIPTKPIPLGFKAPNFALLDTISDQILSYEDIKGTHGTLVMFICNHCPYVIHMRKTLTQLAKDYQAKGVGFVAISSNDVVGYPQDGPDHMKALALAEKFPFPYLYDADQSVAKAYDAVCTPDFDLFDAQERCIYRGQMDSTRPGSGMQSNGEDMRNAIELMLKDETIPAGNQRPSMGCNIKWK
jgi:peroxiredoxin